MSYCAVTLEELKIIHLDTFYLKSAIFNSAINKFQQFINSCKKFCDKQGTEKLMRYFPQKVTCA